MTERSVAVYTSIFGDYTTLKTTQHTDHLDLFCFTESAATAYDPGPWTIVPCRSVFDHPRLDAKYFRLAPEVSLPDHDITVWIDASLVIRDLHALVFAGLRLLPPGGIALYQHPNRTNIHEEAEASTVDWGRKYSGQHLRSQCAHYRAAGFPESHDLWATTILFRDNRSPLTREMNQRWLHECIRWSYQDQLSLPFVLWQMAQAGRQVPVAQLPGNVYEGPYHTWTRCDDR